MAELLYELLPRLRKERDLTVPELSRMTIRMGISEIPEKSIQALESKARAGQVPKAHTLIALAKALEVEPETFYEWPIAEAQANRAAKQRPLGEIAKEAGRLRTDTTRQPPPGDAAHPDSDRAA